MLQLGYLLLSELNFVPELDYVLHGFAGVPDDGEFGVEKGGVGLEVVDHFLVVLAFAVFVDEFHFLRNFFVEFECVAACSAYFVVFDHIDEFI